MSRPASTWIAFGLSLAAGLAAMVWMTLAALDLDRSEREARRQAAVEESARLALWRMDSAAAPLIARENARPHDAYGPFPQAVKATALMAGSSLGATPTLPSAVPFERPPEVRLHFQFGPDGTLSSPQAPAGAGPKASEGPLLEELREKLNFEALAGAIDRQRALFVRFGCEGTIAPPAPEGQSPAQPQAMTQTRVERQSQKESPPVQSVDWQSLRNTSEFQRRAQNYGNINRQQAAVLSPEACTILDASPDELMRPVWVGGLLLLARRVAVGGRSYLQGCWLDWPAIREGLLEEVKDLLPAADLVQAADGGAASGARRLAALPVELRPGEIPLGADPGSSPIRIALIAAWVGLFLGAGAVAALLRGAMSLSERRGAFVSAVTHELRTPLTTFRMYTEMLSAGMVAGEEKRRRYVETLRTEADRLGHLVENVLAYARLEKGRPGGRIEEVRLGDLLDRVRGRLSERAAQAGMTLAVEAAEADRERTLRADPAAVEQVLFNLVDNASKYAAAAADRTLSLEAGFEAGRAALRLRDRGPGIAASDAGRLFRPFSKSAHEAARTAPGVGLGLALSRRLARSMAGDLRLEPPGDDAPGACFCLTLPAV